MLDILYELPDQQPGGQYVVTDAVVRGEENLFRLADRKKESA